MLEYLLHVAVVVPKIKCGKDTVIPRPKRKVLKLSVGGDKLIS